jgi:hypothetical protein
LEDSLTDVLTMVRRFEEAEETTRPARDLAERDRDYRDGKQLTSEEESVLKSRGQPVVIYNRIQRKVNFLRGLETQSRKDPKAFPRTPGDDGSAQAATDALRYVCDDQNWDTKRSDAYENILVEGTGAIMVGAAQVRDGIDPVLTHIPWDRFFHDPYSNRIDFSDASYMGIVTWLDLEDAKTKYPGREEHLEATWLSAKDTQTYDDRPKFNLWADYKRKRVRVVEMYYLERGQWMACTFTKAGYLKDPEASPYLDVDKKPECPIKAISAYIDRDNNRFGEVRAMISPQDEINKRRSKGLHLINSRQIRVSNAVAAAGGMDATAIKREMAKPDGVLFGEADEVEILKTGDMAAANFQMLQEAKAEIDLLGPNAALSGKNENDSSGRALLAQQQGGMVEVALLTDRLRQLSLAVYRSIWGRIKQYWDSQRWLRTTDDERNLKWVGLNVPRTMMEVAAERLQGDPEAEMKLAILSRDPMANQPVEIKNPVAEMDIDITIDEGMDTPTVQSEQFDTLTKIMPGILNLPPPMMKMLIQASSLRDKDQMLEQLDEMAKQPPIPPELQQQIDEGMARLKELEAENERLKADQATKMAEIQQDGQIEAAKAQAKAASDIQIAQIKAQTDIEAARIKAEADRAIAAMKPEPEPARDAA